ncbi:MAG: hydroxyacid dehydrogenase [Clostridia bacterium]|nr:hydroxyacid dehydrogenase [Clostridia bacterium]
MKAAFVCNNKKKLFAVYPDRIIETLAAATGIEPVVYDRDDVLAAPARFAKTELIFSTWGMPTFTEEEIAACFPCLKCVFYAAGTVQAFARPFLNRGIKVFSAWAANGVPVAEYTVAQIVLANKGFFTHSALVKQGRRAETGSLKSAYPGNYEEKVGLIGAGMIGSMVAERLHGYHLEVLVFDPFLSDERAAALGVRKCGLDELFASCRVVSNHLANNAQTQGMLTYTHFSRMLPYATFINTGRGAQVVEDDLVRALTERPDLTALLDVTYPEPPIEGHPFYTLPNCVLTPHIAGSLANEFHRMAEYMADEYARYAAGEPCRYDVSLKMLETMA